MRAILASTPGSAAALLRAQQTKTALFSLLGVIIQAVAH